MNDDELRARLRRIDPVPDEVVLEPSTTPSSRARLERIMSTDLTDSPETGPAAEAGAERRSVPARTRWLLGAAAAALVAVGIGVAALAGDGGGDGGGDQIAAGPPLELNLGASDALASCLAVDAGILATMSPAFGGTATAVEGETVTITVDRWYAGGDAATVQLQAQPGMQALIDGFDFEVGQRYLITASEGTVNFCGFSGPATPELTQLFEQAFGS